MHWFLLVGDFWALFSIFLENSQPESSLPPQRASSTGQDTALWALWTNPAILRQESGFPTEKGYRDLDLSTRISHMETGSRGVTLLFLIQSLPLTWSTWLWLALLSTSAALPRLNRHPLPRAPNFDNRSLPSLSLASQRASPPHTDKEETVGRCYRKERINTENYSLNPASLEWKWICFSILIELSYYLQPLLLLMRELLR